MIKSKKCNVENCKFPRFSEGLCKSHQSLNTRKPPKSLKKISERGIVKKELKRELLLEDLKFYTKIWNSREHRCYESGQMLGHELNICYFHHLLNKKNFPQYRHEEWNIALLTMEIHNQVETNITKCPKVEQLTKELKEKYGNQTNKK